MSNFDLAIDKLLADEGGYVDHPEDPGGETKYGISKRYHPDILISALTKKGAAEIYLKDYWIPSKLEKLNDEKIAEKVFNIGVNIGMRNSIKLVQRAYRSLGRGELTDDGILGPQSISKINDIVDMESRYGIICAFKAQCEGYYRSLKKDTFLNGWLNRAYS